MQQKQFVDPINLERNRRALYQLSRQPGFPILMALLEECIGFYGCEPPKNRDEQLQWMNYTVVDHFVRKFCKTVCVEVEEGERLTKLEAAGEIEDAEEIRPGPGPDGRERA